MTYYLLLNIIVINQTLLPLTMHDMQLAMKYAAINQTLLSITISL